MKILVTGAKGFIGRNLVERLKTFKEYEVIEIDRDNSKEELEKEVLKADFIFHLAGINRPLIEEEFMDGNVKFTKDIIELLISNKKNIPILMSSSIQAELDNPYGVSKKAAEQVLLEYGIRAKAKVYVYRLQNVFGKWCRPNYNSVVATFCNNIARGQDIWISDIHKEITLVYIDDVVKSFIHTMRSNRTTNGYLTISPEYKITLERFIELLKDFKSGRITLRLPDMSDEFVKKLYSTYLSYLPEDDFKYSLDMKTDYRGSFTEVIRNLNMGQISVNISRPGITKGNHWHHTKVEKFLVVSGSGIVKFRKIGEKEVFEYKVSGEKLEVIDIPPGYTHSIINTGTDNMVTVMWANEVFNEETPDTIFQEV
ncbi:polysaccharide biosynthesis C-terminal domain-containing protein [Clostridium culturomicium]|uniref:polysaccharide biosynthesis C-terminal domain-containing protein n=1 Tax=Clostridium culturomicium TaxID=1499683 RepID=UPI0038573EB6